MGTCAHRPAIPQAALSVAIFAAAASFGGCVGVFPAYAPADCDGGCETGTDAALVPNVDARFAADLRGLVRGDGPTFGLRARLYVGDGRAVWSDVAWGGDAVGGLTQSLDLPVAESRDGILRFRPPEALEALGIGSVLVDWRESAAAGLGRLLNDRGELIGVFTLVSAVASSELGGGRYVGVRWPMASSEGLGAFETGTLTFELPRGTNEGGWRLSDRVAGAGAVRAPGEGRVRLDSDGAVIVGEDTSAADAPFWGGVVGARAGAMVAQLATPRGAHDEAPVVSAWFAIRAVERPKVDEVEGCWRGVGLRAGGSGGAEPASVELRLADRTFAWAPSTGGAETGSLFVVQAGVGGVDAQNAGFSLGDPTRSSALSVLFTPNRDVAVLWRTVAQQPAEEMWFALRVPCP